MDESDSPVEESEEIQPGLEQDISLQEGSEDIQSCLEEQEAKFAVQEESLEEQETKFAVEEESLEEQETRSAVQQENEEIQLDLVEQQSSDGQYLKSDDDLKIPICAEEHQDELDIDELSDVESEDQEFVSRSSLPVQELEDIGPLSPFNFDVDVVDIPVASSRPEQKPALPDKVSEASLEQKSFEEQSDICLEEESEIYLEQSDVCLEEPSEVCLEEPSEICLEEPSEVCLEEQSDLCLEERSDICFDEQSYLSSREEKSDIEKNIEEEKNRQKLIEIFQTLQTKENILLRQNYKLQMKLSAGLKSLEKRKYISMPDKADLEEKYEILLGEIEEMWKTDAEQLEMHTREKKELKTLLETNQRNLNQVKNDLLSKQKATAFAAINTRTGRHISAEEIEMCFCRQAAIDEEVKETRLNYVREKRRYRKLRNLPAEKDTSPGSENVHFLQYEELRIASETNQMQLEKLSQELRKMDNVFSTYVQMVTHTKEKLFDLEPDTSYDDQSLENEIIAKKEQLAHLKQKRNESAARLERLRNHYGILSDQNLMRHYDKLQHDLHSKRIQITGIKSDLNTDNTKK